MTIQVEDHNGRQVFHAQEGASNGQLDIWFTFPEALPPGLPMIGDFVTENKDSRRVPKGIYLEVNRYQGDFDVSKPGFHKKPDHKPEEWSFVWEGRRWKIDLFSTPAGLP